MDLKIFVKSFFISIIISFISIFLLAFLLAKTPISENIMEGSIIFISSVSILVGGFLIGKKIKTKGIIYGSIFGLLYMIFFYLISSILSLNFAINLQTIIMILAGIFRRNDRWDFGSKFVKKS